jgi:hypothetical protein
MEHLLPDAAEAAPYAVQGSSAIGVDPETLNGSVIASTGPFVRVDGTFVTAWNLVNASDSADGH